MVFEIYNALFPIITSSCIKTVTKLFWIPIKTIVLARPIWDSVTNPGLSNARIASKSDKKIEAKASLYDYSGDEIGHGAGVFMKSKYLLKDAIGFDTTRKH